ncbi:MBL fold metallo-hydrolase [Tessaracoccus flavescens]|uniref:Metallo-beta-lactamase domain-containing protein n=1 Tax=Tessaracoccus flavescens TaxID=399497 RepID=A0A1Q2CVL9_9ACTN|nr:MBL fold metallo-hydrolase [Tessaracoccus flavescens]AQP50163.1 hypothetical protein BW733_04250 [Tessaracoccus flavescens]
MGTLDHFACGTTTHDLSRVFRGAARQARTFPAGAFLYRSPAATVLFDTGYAPDTADSGVAGWLYSRLLPPSVAPDETIDARLRAAGIDPGEVTHVVLSHAHPDHLGGVRYFPEAQFVLSAGVDASLRSPRLREGVLRGLLPCWFASARRTVIDDAAFVDHTDGDLTVPVHDLLGDGSYLLTPLPGHAHGHLGAIVEGAVLLAGDAAWGADLIDAADDLRPLPRLIQHDAGRYVATARSLRDFHRAGLRVCLSHDTYDMSRLLA